MPSIFQIPEAAFAPFYDTPVAFHGTRPNARPIALTVQCMVVEDSPELLTDAAAPTMSRVFNIVFPARSWLDVTPPHIEERVVFDWGGTEIAAKVCKVSHLPDGDFALVAEWNQKGASKW